MRATYVFTAVDKKGRCVGFEEFGEVAEPVKVWVDDNGVEIREYDDSTYTNAWKYCVRWLQENASSLGVVHAQIDNVYTGTTEKVWDYA